MEQNQFFKFLTLWMAMTRMVIQIGGYTICSENFNLTVKFGARRQKNPHLYVEFDISYYITGSPFPTDFFMLSIKKIFIAEYIKTARLLR